MGDAVERNRAKRLVRELFRHNKPITAVDVVVVPRRDILDASFDRIEAEYRSLLSRTPSTRSRQVVPAESSPRVGPQ
jgi:ribonuclease P protein component